MFQEDYKIEGDDKDLRKELSGTFHDTVSASSHSCFLTGVEGRLEGEKDAMGVRVNSSGNWEVYITTNTKDSKNYYRVWVGCIETPPAYFLDKEIEIQNDNGEIIYSFPKEKSPSVLFDDTIYPDSGFSHSCALASITGRMFNESDFVTIRENDYRNEDRDYTCEDTFAGSGKLCTNWNMILEGDGHIFNQNVSPVGVCFEY